MRLTRRPIQSGQAIVVLSSPVGGAGQVTATVTSPLIGVVNATGTVVFQAVPPAPSKSIGQILGVFLYVIIAAIIAAAIIVAFLFLRRRRKNKPPPAEAEVTQPVDDLEEQPGLDDTGEDTLMFRGNKFSLSGK